MKESNILADNVGKNLVNSGIFQNTEEQFMKESNILVDNVANNSLYREVLRNIKKKVHEGIKHPCQQCDKQFSQKGNLARHLGTVHNIHILE